MAAAAILNFRKVLLRTYIAHVDQHTKFDANPLRICVLAEPCNFIATCMSGYSPDRLSVCLSLCLSSVTQVYCNKMTEDVITPFSRESSAKS